MGAGTPSWSIDFLYPVERPLADSDFAAGAGGSENLVILLSRALARRGHEVAVYCHARDPGRWHGVSWRPIETWNPAAARDITIAFRDFRPLTGPVAARLRVLLLADRRMAGLAAALETGGIDLVAAVSRFQRDEVARAEGITPDDRWIVLPSFGTQTSDYDASPQAKEPGLCHYASAPYRGLSRLLDLWPRIYARVPHTRLVVAASYLHWGHGDTENLERAGELYRRMARMERLGVTNVVRLDRASLVDLQLRSELLLYPAEYDETYCVVALEAQAAGAAVVATRRGALPERVIHGETGYLVDSGVPGWTGRFVDRAVLLLTDHWRRERMGAAGRALAAHGDFAEVAGNWERLWERHLRPAAGQGSGRR